MTLVIIPARMSSTRLPGKPLLKIGDRTIIERCFYQAVKAGFALYVATDSQEIASLFGSNGVITGDCASGTDRVAAAAEIIDPQGKHNFVINMQGDLPFLEPDLLKHFVEVRETVSADILTAYSTEVFVKMFRDPVRFDRTGFNVHIGLYGLTREALRRFAALPPTELEQELRLEQCRAMSSEFTWATTEFPSMPIEINTQADLDRARSCLM